MSITSWSPNAVYIQHEKHVQFTQDQIQKITQNAQITHLNYLFKQTNDLTYLNQILLQSQSITSLSLSCRDNNLRLDPDYLVHILNHSLIKKLCLTRLLYYQRVEELIAKIIRLCPKIKSIAYNGHSWRDIIRALATNNTLQRLKCWTTSYSLPSDLSKLSRAIQQGSLKELYIYFEHDESFLLDRATDSIINLLKLPVEYLKVDTYEGIEQERFEEICQVFENNRTLQSCYIISTSDRINLLADYPRYEQILLRNRGGWTPNHHVTLSNDLQDQFMNYFIHLQVVLPNELSFLILSLV